MSSKSFWYLRTLVTTCLASALLHSSTIAAAVKGTTDTGLKSMTSTRETGNTPSSGGSSGSWPAECDLIKDVLPQDAALSLFKEASYGNVEKWNLAGGCSAENIICPGMSREVWAYINSSPDYGPMVPNFLTTLSSHPEITCAGAFSNNNELDQQCAVALVAAGAVNYPYPDLKSADLMIGFGQNKISGAQLASNICYSKNPIGNLPLGACSILSMGFLGNFRTSETYAAARTNLLKETPQTMPCMEQIQGASTTPPTFNQLAAQYINESPAVRAAIEAEVCDGASNGFGVGVIYQNQMAEALNTIDGFVEVVASDNDQNNFFQDCAGGWSLGAPCDAYALGSRSMAETTYIALPIISNPSTLETRVLCGKGALPASQNSGLSNSAFTMSLTQNSGSDYLPLSSVHNFGDVPAYYIVNGSGGYVGGTFISPSQANTHYAATSLYSAALELRHGLFSSSFLASSGVSSTAIANINAGKRPGAPATILNIDKRTTTPISSPTNSIVNGGTVINYPYLTQGNSLTLRNPLIDIGFSMAELGTLYTDLIAPLPLGQTFPLDSTFYLNNNYVSTAAAILPDDTADKFLGFVALGGPDDPRNYNPSTGMPESSGIAFKAYRAVNLASDACISGSTPSNLTVLPYKPQCDQGFPLNTKPFALIDANGSLANTNGIYWPVSTNAALVNGGIADTDTAANMFTGFFYSVGLGVGIQRSAQLLFKFMSLVDTNNFNYKAFATKVMAAAQSLGFTTMENAYVRDQLLMRGFPVAAGQTALQTIAAEYPPTTTLFSGGTSAQSAHAQAVCAASSIVAGSTVGGASTSTKSFTNSEVVGLTSAPTQHIAIHLSHIAGFAAGPTYALEGSNALGSGVSVRATTPLWRTPQNTEFANLTLFLPAGAAGQVAKLTSVAGCMSAAEYATWFQYQGASFGWIIDSVQLNGIGIKADVVSQTLSPSQINFQFDAIDPICDAGAVCSYSWNIQDSRGYSHVFTTRQVPLTLSKYSIVQIDLTRTSATAGTKTSRFKGSAFALATSQQNYGNIASGPIAPASKWNPMNDVVSPNAYTLRFMNYVISGGNTQMGIMGMPATQTTGSPEGGSTNLATRSFTDSEVPGIAKFSFSRTVATDSACGDNCPETAH